MAGAPTRSQIYVRVSSLRMPKAMGNCQHASNLRCTPITSLKASVEIRDGLLGGIDGHDACEGDE